MTLIYEYDLDVFKMYRSTKNEVSRSRLLIVRARTRQTDTHTQTDTQRNAPETTTSAFAGGKVLKTASLINDKIIEDTYKIVLAYSIFTRT